MDGNGIRPALLRGPGGPVPISIPLTALRTSSSSSSSSSTAAPVEFSLAAPRPETERKDNEYVDTPVNRGALSPLSPISVHHQRPPAPAPPTTPQSPISKQPVSSFNNSSNNKSSSCVKTRPSIMCSTCSRCKCDTCRSPKRLPECWLCNDGCLVSADSIVDYCSCLCCVKGLFYHCSESDDSDTHCADDPCSCGPDRRTARWGCLAALVCALPCLVLYWPLRGGKRAVELCYERHSRAGCRCRPSKTSSSRPPTKRLLSNDTQDI